MTTDLVFGQREALSTLYECAQCCVPGSANHMFNVACDPNPLITSDADLLTKIRCKRCAEKIATDNGKLLNEQGCGVYPLSVTLTRRNRRLTDPVPEGTALYECCAPGCHIRRPSDQMYNRSMGNRLHDEQAGLPDILCEQHAQELAASKGTVPCAPGSHIYRLSYTLRLQKQGDATPLYRGKLREKT